jgi:hypothetical protein
MKKLFLIASSELLLEACGGNSQKTTGGNNGEKSGGKTTEATAGGSVSDTNVGTINHDEYVAGTEASVTITGIPQSVDDFKALQQQIDGEPQGAVALEIIACEVYHQQCKSDGQDCLTLCNVKNNVNCQLQRLKDLFNEKDEYYARPYQMAAFMKGASADNGYNPSKPYTIEVNVDKNAPYEMSDEYGAKLINLQVVSHGHDAGSQRVTVVKPNGSDYFMVCNCPGIYSQVKKIAPGQTFNGL